MNGVAKLLDPGFYGVRYYGVSYEYPGAAARLARKKARRTKALQGSIGTQHRPISRMP